MILFTLAFTVFTIAFEAKPLPHALESSTTSPAAAIATSRDLGDRGVLVVLFTRLRDGNGGAYQYLLVDADNLRVAEKGGYGIEAGGPFGKGSQFLDVFMAPDEEVTVVVYDVPADAYWVFRPKTHNSFERRLLGLPTLKSLGGKPLQAHISGSAKSGDETVELTDGKTIWRYVWGRDARCWRKVAGPTTGPAAQASATAPATAAAE